MEEDKPTTLYNYANKEKHLNPFNMRILTLILKGNAQGTHSVAKLRLSNASLI